MKLRRAEHRGRRGAPRDTAGRIAAIFAAAALSLAASARGDPAAAAPQAAARPAAVPAETPPRNPFWPVGYSPSTPGPAEASGDNAAVAKAAPATADDWERARAEIVIQGVSRGDGDRAAVIINNRVAQVGDVIAVAIAGRVYRWRIEAIDEKGIGLARLDDATRPGADDAGAARP